MCLWSLLRADLLDNEFLVGRHISVEFGHSPATTDPQLVRCTGDESLVVRNAENSVDISDSVPVRLTR
jgi:hypothetical protein